MMLSRRKFLIAGAYSAVGAAFGYGRYLEPFAVEITCVPFEFPNCSVSNGVTWVHLSDFHAFDAMPFWNVLDAISMALYQQPDFVCITGDFVTTKIGDAQMYLRALRHLTKEVRTFAIVGNHDGGAWAANAGGYKTSEPVRQLLEDAGVSVLHNRMEKISIRGSEIQFVGVGDTWAKECDADSAFKTLSSDKATILLSHNPDSKDVLGGYPWDLMLSGHTHGGQLRVPMSGSTPFAPIQDHRYVAGLNAWGERWIYTNRGIGSIAGIRVNCRPEVTVFSTCTSA